MPLYTFTCPSCGRTEDVALRIHERDVEDKAPQCACESGRLVRLITMKRVPTAASFEVKGFNARNGYSGSR